MTRKTRQGQAIRDAFSAHARPLRVEDVHQYARRRVPGVSIATVYRNLHRLQEDGWIVPVSLPDGSTLYERAGKGHHHHFYCRTCGKLLELPGCPLRPSGSVPKGYVVEDHEVFLYGVCDGCATGA